MLVDWKRVVLKSDNIDALYYSEEENAVIVDFCGGSKWRYCPVPPDFIKSYLGELTTRSVLEALRHNNIVGVRIK